MVAIMKPLTRIILSYGLIKQIYRFHRLPLNLCGHLNDVWIEHILTHWKSLFTREHHKKIGCMINVCVCNKLTSKWCNTIGVGPNVYMTGITLSSNGISFIRFIWWNSRPRWINQNVFTCVYWASYIIITAYISCSAEALNRTLTVY